MTVDGGEIGKFLVKCVHRSYFGALEWLGVVRARAQTADVDYVKVELNTSVAILCCPMTLPISWLTVTYERFGGAECSRNRKSLNCNSGQHMKE